MGLCLVMKLWVVLNTGRMGHMGVCLVNEADDALGRFGDINESIWACA